MLLPRVLEKDSENNTGSIKILFSKMPNPNQLCGLLPPPTSLVEQVPSNQKGIMNGPDITNPLMQNLLAQSPQGE